MTLTSRNLKETLTLWPKTGSDGYSGFKFGAPVTLNGRWEERGVLFRTPENEEVVSIGVVYMDQDVVVGDYIAQGDQTATADPTTLPAAWQIRGYNKNTDLRNLQSIRKAFL